MVLETGAARWCSPATPPSPPEIYSTVNAR
jgi:hypothetical protein